MSQTTLEQMKQALAPQPPSAISMNMETVGGFESMQRAAKLFASSSIVPMAYRGNISNCFIAVDMAMRMKANPLMVMQNLYIVHGNPAWSAQFLIATFNKSGRFTALRYEFQGAEGKDDWGCRAISTELATGEKLAGPLITIGMAKKSGWYSKLDKNGNESSKWPSMPEQMLRYRAAAWFVRAYAPEIAMGLQTVEEARDSVIDLEPVENNRFEMSLEKLEEQEAEKPLAENARKPVEASEEAKPAPQNETGLPGAIPATSMPARKKSFRATSLSPGDIICPKENSDGTQRIVEASDCATCRDKTGCPAHS